MTSVIRVADVGFYSTHILLHSSLSARAGIYSIVCLLVLAPSSSYIVTDTNISAIIMQFSYCQAKAKTLVGIIIALNNNK